jgi:hypothetical protein
MAQIQGMKTRRLSGYPEVILTLNGKPISSSTDIDASATDKLVINIDIDALAKALSTKVGGVGIDASALAKEIEDLGLLTPQKLQSVLRTYENEAGCLNCTDSEVTISDTAKRDIAEKITNTLANDLAKTDVIKKLATKTDIEGVKTATVNAVNGLNKSITSINTGITEINNKLKNQPQAQIDTDKIQSVVKTATTDSVKEYFSGKVSGGFANSVASGISAKNSALVKNISEESAKLATNNEQNARNRYACFFASLVLALMAMMFTFFIVILNKDRIFLCFLTTLISFACTLAIGASVGMVTKKSDGTFVPATIDITPIGLLINALADILLIVFVFIEVF